MEHTFQALCPSYCQGWHVCRFCRSKNRSLIPGAQRVFALVPKPRVNLTRFHGVFAPHSKYRARVTPARRGKGRKIRTPEETPEQTPAERRVSMTWAKRLKRVFNIDIETCCECGGAVKIIACIEDPVVIQKILDHLQEKAALAGLDLLPQCRAPP